MGEPRRVGIAVDFSPCSRKAIKWSLDNFIQPNDHLILVVVRPTIYYESGEMQLWETTGSPLIPLREFADEKSLKKYETTIDPETLEIVADGANQKGITNVLMKILWGDPRDKLCEAVDKIPLDCLIMGNRGLGTIQRAFMGSVSNYVVNTANCPVTVVKCQDKA